MILRGYNLIHGKYRKKGRKRVIGKQVKIEVINQVYQSSTTCVSMR